MALQIYEKPLMLAYSGGKDSDVLLDLALKAKIPMQIVYSLTTVDAPETVHHVRDVFSRLDMRGVSCAEARPEYKGKPVTMWTLIPQKRMPPTRLVRYCCDVMKEQVGKGAFCATGVRWAESVARKNSRGVMEVNTRKKEDRIILTNDNDEKRRLFETCRMKAKRTVNPIVDWTDADIFDYIHASGVQINSLYARGWKRVGCIGCPFASKHAREFEFAQYPTYKRAYLRAFEKMLRAREAAGLKTEWQSAQDVFRWWMEYDVLPGQMSLLEEGDNI